MFTMCARIKNSCQAQRVAGSLSVFHISLVLGLGLLLIQFFSISAFPNDIGSDWSHQFVSQFQKEFCQLSSVHLLQSNSQWEHLKQNFSRIQSHGVQITNVPLWPWDCHPSLCKQSPSYLGSGTGNVTLGPSSDEGKSRSLSLVSPPVRLQGREFGCQ